MKNEIFKGPIEKQFLKYEFYEGSQKANKRFEFISIFSKKSTIFFHFRITVKQCEIVNN